MNNSFPTIKAKPYWRSLFIDLVLSLEQTLKPTGVALRLVIKSLLPIQLLEG